MSNKISPREILEHIAFGSLDTIEQEVVNSAATCDKVGVPYNERMTGGEIEKLHAVQDKFFPVRKPGRMFPRFANNGQPTSTDKHDWEFNPGDPPKSFIVRYYNRSREGDPYVDQTSVDKNNEQLIWKLFEEFGHKQTADTFYEIEPVNETDISTSYPKTGWHDTDVYTVSYADIEVLIDRQADGEVEIRIWRNGKY